MTFEQWWADYFTKDGNEVLSDYEKDVAKDAWMAALENGEPDDNFPLTD